MMLIIGICFLAFLVIYAIAGSAIIYHLNAFSLPEWKMRHVAIVIFIILAIVFAESSRKSLCLPPCTIPNSACVD